MSPAWWTRYAAYLSRYAPTIVYGRELTPHEWTTFRARLICNRLSILPHCEDTRPTLDRVLEEYVKLYADPSYVSSFARFGHLIRLRDECFRVVSMLDQRAVDSYMMGGTRDGLRLDQCSYALVAAADATAELIPGHQRMSLHNALKAMHYESDMRKLIERERLTIEEMLK